jgi:hypothetical protein
MQFSTDKISLYEIDDVVWVNIPSPTKGKVVEIFERPHMWLYKIKIGENERDFIEDDIFKTRQDARDEIRYWKQLYEHRNK